MKRKLSIIISIIVVLGIIVGVTLAMFGKTVFTQNVSFNIGGITVTYNAGNNITGSQLIPVTTLEKGLTDNTAIEKTITVSSSNTAYFNLYLDVNTLGSGLKRDYVVWQIKKGNTIVNSGNFANVNVNDTINLLNYEEINSTTSTYTLYIWIDGSVDNDESVEGQAYNFTLRADAVDHDPRLDKSGANSPDLVEGLIPVRYDETNSTWVKADVNNMDANNQWYDYDSKMWANAVLVSSTSRSTYMNANAGTAIPESDVLAYYVWIPRYKYKVWNIAKSTSMTNNLNAKTQGIDIVFEGGRASTGTVSCNYNFAITDGSLSEICTGNNGDYYTHPAFTFGSTQVRGIWVGKFEISSETPDVQTSGNYYGGGNVTNLTVRVKPNVRSWRYNTVSNFYKVIYDMQTTNNIYGLSTNRSNTDSHMLKNIEWGAVAYLTNSKYGRCSNNICTEVTINNSSDYITGNAGNTVSASSASGTTNAYNTTAGQLASTTGNIYGIYDMSGGAYEYVMGNMSSAAGSYTYYPRNAGSNYTYSGNEKYIDTYANGSSYNNQTAYNRSRLGDATGETKSWYSDGAIFVYSSYSWFLRGGYYSVTTSAGPFAFYGSYNGGGSDSTYSARLALLSTSN